MKRDNDNKTLLWINSAVKGKRRYIFFLTVLQTLMGFYGVSYALMLRSIIDNAVAGNADGVKLYALIMIILVVTQIFLRMLIRYLDEFTRSGVENRLKSRLFSGVLNSDFASVTAIHSGEWINRMTSDCAVVANDVTQIVPGLLGTVVRISAALVMLLAMEPRFSVFFFVGAIALIGVTMLLRRKMKQMHMKMQEADGDLRVLLTERLGSLLTIRAFSKEEQVLQQAQEKMDIHRDTRLKRAVYSTVCNSGLVLVMNGAYVLGAVYGGFAILNGHMSYGTFSAVLQLIGQVQAPISSVSGFVPRYYAMLASAERLMAVEDFDDDRSEAAKDINGFYQDQLKSIELRNVSFSYKKSGEAPQVLRDLNLSLRKGEYVAFTGPSGCGKSTVLKLLMNLYQTDGGERLLVTEAGEQPLTSQWRGLFAYVPQGNQLMNGTIREVVTFGEITDNSRDEEIFRALEISCADNFVRELKDGLDTVLGERGSGLSEGQMQRIAIARAIFSDRPILLLDEATSALDDDTEKRVLSNLRRMTNKTVIIVTHRPAVLAITDQEVRFAGIQNEDALNV